MDEVDLLPRTMACIASQTFRNFKVFICVNQPDAWWDDPQRKDHCRNNIKTLEYLNSFTGFDLVVIDFASPGNGWKGKRHGVGWARKTLMDAIVSESDSKDVVVSLDADTVFDEHYFFSVAQNFRDHPSAVALAVPYFHKTGADPEADSAILRYEIYMRHYLLNLFLIGSPYAFTALGSAMAFPVWAYRAIGGMTPKMSGEDFYFLQKLAKYGPILLWNEVLVHPEARFSDRVFFGTGPAMIKGRQGDWTSYPIYHFSLFNDILETYVLLPLFATATIPTKVSGFLADQLHEEDPWQPLRENHKVPERFYRAFHEKLDGLRILQYLKANIDQTACSDEACLKLFLDQNYPDFEVSDLRIAWKDFSFSNAKVEELERIRMFLYEKEMEQRFISTLP
jgi:hypothetical protein